MPVSHSDYFYVFYSVARAEKNTIIIIIMMIVSKGRVKFWWFRDYPFELKIISNDPSKRTHSINKNEPAQQPHSNWIVGHIS